MPEARYPRLQAESLPVVLRLLRSSQVGPVTFFQLLRRYGSPEAALRALPDHWARGNAKDRRMADAAAVQQEIEAGQRLGARFLLYGAEAYPESLWHLYDPPPVLMCVGDPSYLAGRMAVGIVGARNASAAGRHFTKKLAADLGGAGVTVVSGLARGIDTAAHEGALATGTVAVTACGLDVVYPPENHALHARIAEMGCIVSEQPFGTPPVTTHFPRRNRILSGLSRAVVVVEAARHSGSLITARYALEQGREVCAVPGSPLDPRSSGPNHLLKEGALLVESAEDILALLREGHASVAAGVEEAALEAEPSLFAASEDALARLRTGVGASPVLVDALLEACQVSPQEAATLLLDLELSGEIERLPGNQVVRRVA